MERDEVWVPQTRSEMKSHSENSWLHLDDYLGDTPLYTLVNLVAQQLVGYQMYIGAQGMRVDIMTRLV